MAERFVDKEFYGMCIDDVLVCLCDKEHVAIFPGFDEAASKGEVIDRGRFLRIELDFTEEMIDPISRRFQRLAQSLAEIGQWYLQTGTKFGMKPDEKALREPVAMKVWNTYISGYKDFDISREGIASYCKAHGIEGKAPDLLAFMCYRYCTYESIGAPEIVLINAARELACAFVINGFSIKTERIDMLMEERDVWSYFPERKDLDLRDFMRIADLLQDPDYRTTRKASIFYQETRTDEDIKQLYKALLRFDFGRED